MNNQKGFAPIVLVLIVVALLAGGILAWQYFGAPKEEVKAPEEVVKDETADWKTYTNSRVGYKFSYPSTNLTLALDETIKYPSTREGDSKTQDLVQFAVGKTSFGIRTYVSEGKSTIESWIQEPNTPRAYHDLNKYEKVTVGVKTAYRIKGEAFVYVLANGNVYEITAYQNIAPAKVSDEPLFEKWVATIEFTK